MTDSTHLDKQGNFETLENYARPYVMVKEELLEYNMQFFR